MVMVSTRYFMEAQCETHTQSTHELLEAVGMGRGGVHGRKCLLEAE
jgi:hypothetical protein